MKILVNYIKWKFQDWGLFLSNPKKLETVTSICFNAQSDPSSFNACKISSKVDLSKQLFGK